MKRKLQSILKSNRIRIPLAMFLAALIVVILGLSAILLYYPARSVLWHCLNGNVAHLGSNTVKLPLFWWQEKAGKNGNIEIRHARFGAGVAWNILFIPLKGEGVKMTDEEAEEWQRTFVAAWNRSGKSHSIPVSIVAPRGTIYCLRDQSTPLFSDLFCRAAGVSWGIGFSGLGSEEADVESILASMR